MDSVEKRIRKRAYDLWERAGRPEGRSEEFWFAAAVEAVQASETRYRAIVNSSPAAIICIDENGIVQSANPATKTILGYEADELLGRNVSIIMPDYHASRHDGYLDAYLETGVGKIIGIGREVTARRKDGGMIDVELSIGEWRDDAGRQFFAGALQLAARNRNARQCFATRRARRATHASDTAVKPMRLTRRRDRRHADRVWNKAGRVRPKPQKASERVGVDVGHPLRMESKFRVRETKGAARLGWSPARPPRKCGAGAQFEYGVDARKYVQRPKFFAATRKDVGREGDQLVQLPVVPPNSAFSGEVRSNCPILFGHTDEHNPRLQ